jgi:muramoyltetrapeptide carboxypeptidase
VDPVRLDAGLAILGQRYAIHCDRDGLLTRAGYLAGDDQRRADELNAALSDPEIRAIFMARGGYGLTRILARLDADALRSNPKLVVGFSDGTALLSWALAAAGVRGVHGPVVGQLGSLEPSDHQALFDLMESSEPPGLVATGLAAMGAPLPGEVSGPLVPGNLCLQAHLVGTPYSALAPGCVPVIEEVGERPYAVDRYLTHLYDSGSLEGVEAVVVGDFTGCVETKMQDNPSVYEVIDERLTAFGIAGLRFDGVGHGTGNRALPFGANATVASGQLSITEAAVS